MGQGLAHDYPERTGCGFSIRATSQVLPLAESPPMRYDVIIVKTLAYLLVVLLLATPAFSFSITNTGDRHLNNGVNLVGDGTETIVANQPG